MRNRSIGLIAFLLFLIIAMPAQDVSNSEAIKEGEEKTKETAGQKKEISLLLVKETAAEIEQLQSLTNRISFSADLAEIAYGLDPALSRRMYVELSDSLSRFITSQSQLITDKDRSAGVMIYRNASRTVWKLRRASSIRGQAVLSAAKNDPILALDLLDATKLPPEVAETLGYFGVNDDALLMRIASTMPLDDPETLAEFGDRLLKNGLNVGAPILLVKLKEKGHPDAMTYAAKVLSAASREVDSVDPNLDAISMLLRIAGEKPKSGVPPPQPLFDPAEIRSLAEAFGRAVLRIETEDMQNSGSAMQYAAVVRPFSTDLADRIQSKYAAESGGFGTGGGIAAEAEAFRATPPPPPPPAASGEGSVMSAPMSREEAALQQEKERAAELEEKIGSPERSDEKDAAVREYVASALYNVGEIDDPMAKTIAYVVVVDRLEQLGQKEAASEVLSEAFRSIPSNPRNYQDFLQTWTLAGALVEREPDRAFTMIEDLVFRLNGVVANFHGFAEFLDSSGEILDEGELQFGGFGGGMMTQMVRTLDSTGRIMSKLAEADLARTRALAERFDRPEIRVTARLLIIKSFAQEKQDAVLEESPQIVITTEGEN